jgi:hypothetical protein
MPEEFGPTDSIGILSGRLSGDLVCVDIDCSAALTAADRYLPRTSMEEGRPGKPRSHRWYRVKDIPQEWTATCSGGMGGPRTVPFARGKEAGQMVIEFRGTGAQAVVPASLWTSKDGTQQERRVWHSFEEPAELGYRELLEAVARLATAFGGRNTRWEAAARPRKSRSAARTVLPPAQLPLPTGDVAEKARAYLRKMRPAVQGESGDHHTFTVACVLVRDFALTVEEALPLLLEWNTRCVPPWTVEELVHKLKWAETQDGPRGSKLRPQSARTIDITLRPGDPAIFVGVDCVKPGFSYVNLAPDLWAALVKHGRNYRLEASLDAIDWTGKLVTLVPPSTVLTNKKAVYDEFKLAVLLRERGAEVRCLRIRSDNGQRLTLAQAEEVEETTPPLTVEDAEIAAQAASRKGRELSRIRRSLPRNKRSAKLEDAINWLMNQKTKQVTKELIKKAKKRGLSQTTLYRAIQAIRQRNTTV